MRFTATTLDALKLELERELGARDPVNGPQPIYACATSGMPAAGAFTNCVLRNTTLDVLAVSNGAAWIRQDTGAAI